MRNDKIIIGGRTFHRLLPSPDHDRPLIEFLTVALVDEAGEHPTTEFLWQELDIEDALNIGQVIANGWGTDPLFLWPTKTAKVIAVLGTFVIAQTIFLFGPGRLIVQLTGSLLVMIESLFAAIKVRRST